MTPPAPPWTPERLAETKALCEEYQSLNTVERWREIVEQRSASLPDALAEIERLTLDIDAMRANLHATFNGGHHDEPARRAFHHGMDTVCNVLAAHQKRQSTNEILPHPPDPRGRERGMSDHPRDAQDAVELDQKHRAMTERTFTAADMAEEAEWLSRVSVVDFARIPDGALKLLKTTAAMLRQAAAASEREAALREEIEGWRAGSEARKQALAAKDAEIARLTGELKAVDYALGFPYPNSHVRADLITAERQKVQALRDIIKGHHDAALDLLERRGRDVIAFVKSKDSDAGYQVGMLLDNLARVAGFPEWPGYTTQLPRAEP